MKQYIVPRRVSARYEIIPGFGLLETALLAGGIAVSAIVWWVVGVIHAPAAARLAAPLPTLATLFLVVRPEGGRSPWQTLQAMREFRGGILRYRRDVQ